NRVFNINEGLNVTIAGLTITHGRPKDNGNGGGGILNAGSVVALADDLFSYNQADPNGGGISNQVGGALTVSHSTFVGNQAVTQDPLVYAEGGAIWNPGHGAAATVIDCTFIGNKAIGGSGGVVRNGTMYNFAGAANGGAIH